jgi:hypothetical protein
MEGDIPGWVRQFGVRLAERCLRPDSSLPKPISERLRALEEAERRRNGVHEQGPEHQDEPR